MKHDELFRKALQRQNDRAARMKMPDHMEQRVTDRIKLKNKSHHWLYAVSVGAVAASILLMFTLFYEGRKIEPKERPVIAQQTEQRNNVIRDEVKPDTELVQYPASTNYAKREQARPKVRKSPPMNSVKDPDVESTPAATADQLNDYIARLEAEMEAVDDSVRAAHLEKIIAADYRLQLLVNRIVKGEMEQALRELHEDSTANYINF